MRPPTAAGGRARHGRPAKAASARERSTVSLPRAAEASTLNPNRVTYELLNVGKALCEELKVTQSWKRECDQVAAAGNWAWGELKAHLENVEPVTAPQVVPDMEIIKKVDPVNNSGTTDSYSKILTYRQGTNYETNKCFSFKFGQGLEVEGSAEFQIPVVGKTGVKTTVKVNTEEDWSDCNKKATDTVKETNDTIGPLGLEPYKVTHILIWQETAKLSFDYTADVTAGKDGVAQPIKTPLARALGMSPARLQPCVGYLAGGSGLAIPTVSPGSPRSSMRRAPDPGIRTSPISPGRSMRCRACRPIPLITAPVSRKATRPL